MNRAGKQDHRSSAAPTVKGRPSQDGGARIEGEGNYTAARRHRKSVEEFIDDGRVEEAAREAAPDSPEEAEAMRRAEREGRRHARK